jgi:hypothetical protein
LLGEWSELWLLRSSSLAKTLSSHAEQVQPVRVMGQTEKNRTNRETNGDGTILPASEASSDGWESGRFLLRTRVLSLDSVESLEAAEPDLTGVEVISHGLMEESIVVAGSRGTDAASEQVGEIGVYSAVRYSTAWSTPSRLCKGQRSGYSLKSLTLRISSRYNDKKCQHTR